MSKQAGKRSILLNPLSPNMVHTVPDTGKPCVPDGFLPIDWQTRSASVRDALAASTTAETDSLLRQGGSLSFPHVADPLVSIIIVTCNKAHYTYNCLKSLLLFTDGVPYEVVIVDNASTDSTRRLLGQLEHVTVHYNNTNTGFGAACNQAAVQAKGSYLCFLNNDTIVTGGWLNSLVSALENYPDCGAVGAKLVYPEGILQEAGSLLWADGTPHAYGRGDDALRPEYSYVREVAFCSGACLLVRKEIFLELGGFDNRLQPAYYEDCDLCIGIQATGQKVVYQPKSVVFHMEHGTSQPHIAARQFKINRQSIMEKQVAYFADRPPNTPENVLKARDESKGKRILVLDDRIPAPYLGSGFPRTYALLMSLVGLGYKPSFFPLADPSPCQPWLDQLQQAGVEMFYAPYNDFARLLAERRDYYDAVIISRPGNAAQYLQPIAESWSTSAIIYDAEALFCLRDLQVRSLNGEYVGEEMRRELIERELAPARYADIIIAVSEQERNTIIQHVNRPCIQWGYPLPVKEPEEPFSNRKDILFVGGFLAPSSPNEDAVIHFAMDIWPRIRGPLDCRLFVVGSNPQARVRQLECRDIIVTGYVEDLKEYYQKCRVFIASHRYAAGIPLKVLEAMNEGIPCVISGLLGSQLAVRDGCEALVAESDQAFADHVRNIYENEPLWLSVQQNALRYVRQSCDGAKLTSTLDAIISTAIASKHSDAESKETSPAKVIAAPFTRRLNSTAPLLWRR